MSPAVRISIFGTVHDTFAGRPVYELVVERARSAGLPGATVVVGLEGYGGSGQLHRPGLLSRADAAPMLIEFVGPEHRLFEFLTAVEELIGNSLIVVQPVFVTAPVQARPAAAL